jgi:DNA-binding FadR family transcriptional regulator
MVAFVVSPHRGTPVYHQVANALRGRIAQGELLPGTSLSSEKDIAAEFSVGRDAVRDALALLRAEGLIETKRGYRSKVREPIVRERLALPKGQVLRARMPTPEERVEHDVCEGVPMFVVDGVGYPADRFEFVSE